MAFLPETMKGVQLSGHGGYDKLVFRENIPVPQPAPGEVLIKVGAAGVNNTDINTRIGWYSKSQNGEEDAAWTGDAIRFPRIQGIDVCGRIAAVGSGIQSSRINERVLIEPCLLEAKGKTLSQPWFLGSECDGGFAEYTVVAARHAHSINSLHSDVELASFPCSYSTAENLLTRTRVSSKDVVLVTGASGGVGSAAIQLAKARGAYVIGVTMSSKASKLLDLGADKTIERNTDPVHELGPNSVDVVIDLVAGRTWPNLLDVLKPHGRYGVAGAIAGPLVELDVRTLYLKDLSLYGCTVLDECVFPELIKRIERGDVLPLVEKTFSLLQIAEAQKQFELKQHIGKFVIDLANI